MNGIFESSATAPSRPDSPRGAPFGVPVVPEVRITGRVACSGTGCLSVEPFSISSSTVGTSPVPPSCQAITLGRSMPDFSISSVNSSSYTIAAGFSRSHTSPSWVPEKAVLR